MLNSWLSTRHRSW